ncbi:hypothetical protein J1785_21810 [Rahnella sp. SL6]|uniref:hypothetical protein n=1 Tax=Rahnella perminowiae TaxID=2816244 RepID=UPI001C27EA82|nr:hypothetical protein [Rahnella perminowiae]MBU9812353.1 hypothetical protein [Rahnella perminowiae]
MKKLTLEKAQELLEFLKGKAASGDITISQENYLQAMELAVMALSAMQAKPIGYISERNLNALGKQFSVCVKHEPVMVRPIPLYTTPQSAHMEPVIPEGYALVPIEPTEDMVINGFESKPDQFFSSDEEWEAYEEMSGCAQAAHRAKLCWAAMIAAAPKPEAL